jgi:hypothetical protein
VGRGGMGWVGWGGEGGGGKEGAPVFPHGVTLFSGEII